MPAGDPPLTLADLREIDLGRLKGVGPALEARLAEMGLLTVLDLLQHYPRRWVDRTKRVEIAALEVGEAATVIGEVRSVHARRTRNRKALVEVVIHDGSSLLNVTFFNQAWREKQLAVGTEVSLYGKLDVYRGKRQMTMPVVDVLGRAGVADDKTGVILPVYPQSGKAEVFTWQLRTLVGEALAKCAPRGFADPVDEELLHRHDLIDRTVAMRAIHRPDSMAEQRAAYRRLVFDEFLRMQVGLVARKRALAAEQSGIRHTVVGPLVDAFLAQLPFALDRRSVAGDRRDHPRHGRPGADAPPPAGRRRIGQDGGGPRRAARGGPGRIPGRVHGSHRSAGRAALSRLGEAARGVDGRRASTRCWPTGRCGSSCSPTARPRPSAGASPRAWPRPRSTSWWARTRCSTATPSSRIWVSP